MRIPVLFGSPGTLFRLQSQFKLAAPEKVSPIRMFKILFKLENSQLVSNVLGTKHGIGGAPGNYTDLQGYFQILFCNFDPPF